MARIRSIKPEFWSDEKIAQLSEGGMAFFIGLWNFCDDEGKCEDNPGQLALRMPVFRREDISRWIKKLVALGLLERGSLVAPERLTSGSPVAWLRVTNWSHQRINRPVPAKIKSDEIQWLKHSDSLLAHANVMSEQRKDRIGSDRIGSDRIGTSVADKPQAPPPKTPTLIPKTNAAIAAYCDGWKSRYGSSPPIGGKEAGIVKRLVKDLGETKAIEYLEAYLRMPDPWFVKKRHDLATFSGSLNSVAHFIQSGRVVTNSDLRQLDQAVTNQGTLEAIRRGEI